jgi:hypothetical protein
MKMKLSRRTGRRKKWKGGWKREWFFRFCGAGMESFQAWIADGPQHIIRFFLRMAFDEGFSFFSEFLRGVLADGGRLLWGFCGEVVVECVADVVSWWSLFESEKEDSLLGFIFVGP